MNLLQNFDTVKLLLKIKPERDRRPNVVILKCLNCQWEGGEVRKMRRW